MRPELLALAATDAGLLTRRAALAAGVTERELRTATGHGGPWLAVRRGCYVQRHVWQHLDEDDRYRLRVRAAYLTGDRDCAVSHQSAAALHGMPLRPRWLDLVHVTRPGVTGSRTEHGVKHHRAATPADQLLFLDGVRLTTLARTAVDVAREQRHLEDGVIATDAAMRLGVAREAMTAVVAGMSCWPNVTRARAAVDLADPGAQSPGETLLRLMVVELRLGPVSTQFVVREGSRWAAADVRVRRHLFEFDGRVKYVGRDDGGVADRPLEEVVWAEKQREDMLRRADGGYGVSRVTWAELFPPLRERTMQRLRREYAETVARFGTQVA